MSNSMLSVSDAVIAIPQNLLEKSIQLLFDEEKLNAKIDIVINEEEDKSLEASFKAPNIKFLFDAQHGPRARMTFPISEGTYKGGSKVVKGKDGKKEIVDVLIPWAGKYLEYEVKLNSEAHPFHDSELTIEAIYLELTQIRNINLDELGLAPDEAQDIETAIKALAYVFKDSYKGSTSLDSDDQPPRLFIGKVNIPQVPDTQGILAPKVSRHTVTEGEPTNEMDFLLYIYNDSDPRLKQFIGTFDKPWVAERENTESDALLVLSQFILLEQLLKPAIQKQIGEKKGNLVVKTIQVDGGDRPSLSLENAPQPNTDEVQVTSFEAHITGVESNKKLIIDLVFEGKKIEALQPPNWSNLTIVKVLIGRRHRVTFELEITADGSFKFNKRSDTEESIPPEVIWDTAVDKPEDIVKWILTVISPLMITIATTIGLVIKEAIDVKTIQSISDNFAKNVETLSQSVELPGATVFKYGDPRFVDGNLLFDGTRIPLPSVKTTDNKAYETVGLPPRIESLEQMPPETTEAVFLGEALVNYHYVKDPKLNGKRGEISPYYRLSREQFWYRGDMKRRSGLNQTTIELSSRVGITKEEQTRMSETLNMSISANGSLQFDAVTIGLEASISKELQQETTTRVEKATEETYTNTIDFPSTDGKPYLVALWLLADRYSLRRMDGSAVESYTIYDKRHAIEMGYPELDWENEKELTEEEDAQF